MRRRSRSGQSLILAIFFIILALAILALLINLGLARVESARLHSQAANEALELAREERQDSEATVTGESPILFGQGAQPGDSITFEVTARAELRPAISAGVYNPIVGAGLINGQISVQDWNQGLLENLEIFPEQNLQAISIGQPPFSLEPPPGEELDEPPTLMRVPVGFIAITQSNWGFPPAVIGFGAVDSRLADLDVEPPVPPLKVTNPPISNVTNVFVPGEFAETDEGRLGIFIQAVFSENRSIPDGLVAPAITSGRQNQ